PKVRRALNLLTDRAIITKVAGRGDKEAFQLTPPNMQGGGESAPAWKPLKREARIAEAKKLLREAGYSEEKPLEFQIVYTTSEAAKKQITALQSIWKATVPFVRPTLMNEEWKTFLDKRLQGNFSMAFAGWCSDYNDPAGMLNIFKSNNPNNAFHYKNPEFDKLMNSTLEAGISAEERARRYVSAEAMLQRDDAFIPLYHQVSINLVKPDIQGYSDHDPLKNYTIKNWSFAPKK
ncbi:MAG: oligopeptide ABC transporter substrate-binding protein OppA, partial [Neisseria sp.]